MRPLISVIMPVYNCEKTVSTAIESILNQTLKDLELIVVDDASTDGTRSIVEGIQRRDARVKIVAGEDDPNRYDPKLDRNINAGYSARNTGLALARGEYITFQDADDASLLNRLEVQLRLLNEYKATHILTDWLPFNEKFLNTEGDIRIQGPVLESKDLFELSQKTKGLVAKISPSFNKMVPFHIKRKRILHKLFFGSLTPFPGAGNSPFFKRKVIEKVMFRRLKERTWPSFMGRGADRDFNFQVAETFKNSFVIPIKLYMWRK